MLDDKITDADMSTALTTLKSGSPSSGKIDWQTVLVACIDSMLAPEIHYLIQLLMDTQPADIKNFPMIFSRHSSIVAFLGAEGYMSHSNFLEKYAPVFQKTSQISQGYPTVSLTGGDTQKIGTLIADKDPTYNTTQYLTKYNKWKLNRINEMASGYIRF